jgi:O-antigen ligase
MKNKILYNYFFILFSIIPISIIVGSAVSSINVIIIALSFLLYAFYLKDWKWLKNKNIRLFLILYLYLIFNSFISLDFNIGINRNFGFILYIIFFAAFNHFFLNYKKFDRIFLVWFIIIAIVAIDIYLEAFTGKSMTGYYSNSLKVHDRIYSFFIDEAKVGGFIGCFFLILTGYFLNLCQFKLNKWKYLVIIISIIFLLSIILTGERSSAIRALIGFLMFFIITKSFTIKEKIISLIFVILIFGIVYSNSPFIKYRYGKLIFEKLSTIGQVIKYVKRVNFSQSSDKNINITIKESALPLYPADDEIFRRTIGSNYVALYISSIKVFVKYPIFGVGNKNYRVATCKKYAADETKTVYYQFYKFTDSKIPELFNSQYVCNTHPHQIYFEFLAEHGIIGMLILLFVFFKIIYQLFRKNNLNESNLQLGAFVYIVLVFIPLLPGGAFFNNYALTLFWINMSIMLMSTSKNANLSK